MNRPIGRGAAFFLWAALLPSCAEPTQGPIPAWDRSAKRATIADVEILDDKKLIVGSLREHTTPQVDTPPGHDPCVVDLKRVYLEIPDYQDLKERGLEREDAEYYICLKHAADRFHLVVRRTAASLGFDLVFEKSGLRLKPGVTGVILPDITADVVEDLRRP